jgi:hypothetical protein
MMNLISARAVGVKGARFGPGSRGRDLFGLGEVGARYGRDGIHGNQRGELNCDCGLRPNTQRGNSNQFNIYNTKVVKLGTKGGNLCANNPFPIA